MNGRTNASSTANGILQVPLDPPTLFVAEGSHEKISLTWTDPKTKYATPEGEVTEDTDQIVATWDHTVIVRKTDGYPATPNDGIVVISSGQYNQYQSTPYVDTGLTNQTQYYYAAFAFNSDGIPSEPAHVECFLYGYDEVFANNSWEYIDRACSEDLHTSLWEIGDTKTGVADGCEMTYAIAGFNLDNLADGSGKACMTLTSVNVMKDKFYNFGYKNYDYTDSPQWSYLNGTVRNRLSDNLLSVIKPVKKYAYGRNGRELEFTAYLFTMRDNELDGPVNDEKNFQYPYYTTYANRLKTENQYVWMLRDSDGDDTGGSTYVDVITWGGDVGHWYSNDGNIMVCFNFCIGKSAV